jgi:hypothetical protein
VDAEYLSRMRMRMLKCILDAYVQTFGCNNIMHHASALLVQMHDAHDTRMRDTYTYAFIRGHTQAYAVIRHTHTSV